MNIEARLFTGTFISKQYMPEHVNGTITVDVGQVGHDSTFRALGRMVYKGVYRNGEVVDFDMKGEVRNIFGEVQIVLTATTLSQRTFSIVMTKAGTGLRGRYDLKPGIDHGVISLS
jgi:hypothetical protein